jgi:hypothetical protein
MTALPHDVSDIFLAPVVLALDARIEELGRLSVEQLADTVALESDLADFTPEMRRDGLLRSVQHFVAVHGWEASWDERGIRISHGANHLVLGIPGNFREYIAGTGH